MAAYANLGVLVACNHAFVGATPHTCVAVDPSVVPPTVEPIDMGIYSDALALSELPVAGETRLLTIGVSGTPGVTEAVLNVTDGVDLASSPVLNGEYVFNDIPYNYACVAQSLEDPNEVSSCLQIKCSQALNY